MLRSDWDMAHFFPKAVIYIVVTGHDILVYGDVAAVVPTTASGPAKTSLLLHLVSSCKSPSVRPSICPSAHPLAPTFIIAASNTTWASACH